jgi:hypothetical protein
MPCPHPEASLEIDLDEPYNILDVSLRLHLSLLRSS